MNKKRKILIGIVTVLVLVTLYFVYEHIMFVTTDNAQVQARTVMLSAKVSGYVTKVNVEENQKVKAGDVLVEIEARDYQNNLNQITNQTQSTKARLNDAEKNYHRISNLFKQGAVSQQQLDNAQAAYNEALHGYEALQAQVSQAQLNLDYTKIKAPSNGVIARKSVELGMLAPMGTPLLGFVSSEERWVVANFKETELPDIKIGNKVDIKIDALPGRKFTGHVESLSPATGATFTLLPPDNATGNFTKVVQRVPVRIVFEGLNANDVDLLQAGLSAEVKVHK
jgi:membrane fusion protein (multidrug efflux system)